MGEVTTVMVRFFGSGAVSGSGGGGGGIFDFEDFWSEMRSPLRPPSSSSRPTSTDETKECFSPQI